MNQDFCRVLACPNCKGSLRAEVLEAEGDDVRSGSLRCAGCSSRYPIVRGIPRFVSDEQDYCENFGWQWERFRRTQIDQFTGLKESENRFKSETGWTPEDLRGLLVLDGGCGAGRFSAIASEWGAKVVAVDISAAVDACAANMKELGRDVEVVQASLFDLPFRPETFDRIFSLGVVHHTPDPKRAIRLLPELLKPGGRLAFWIYEKRWTRFLMTRNLIRVVTRKLPRWANYSFSVLAVSLLFPVTALISLIPPLRRGLPLIPISSRHYWGRLSLSEQWEWTVLDTFDSYSAAYENCQEEKDVIAELTAVGMAEVLRTPARGMSIVARRPAG